MLIDHVVVFFISRKKFFNIYTRGRRNELICDSTLYQFFHRINKVWHVQISLFRNTVLYESVVDIVHTYPYTLHSRKNYWIISIQKVVNHFEKYTCRFYTLQVVEIVCEKMFLWKYYMHKLIWRFLIRRMWNLRVK